MCFGLGREGLDGHPISGMRSARSPRDLPALFVMFESLAVCGPCKI